MRNAFRNTNIHSDGLFSEHIYFRDKTLIVGTTIIMFAIVIYYAFPPLRLSIGTFQFCTSESKLGINVMAEMRYIYTTSVCLKRIIK